MKQSKKQNMNNLTSQAQNEVTNYTMANLSNNAGMVGQEMQAESMQNMTSNTNAMNSMQNEAMANMQNQSMPNLSNNASEMNQGMKKTNKKSQDQQNGMY